jgi:hypothetical protein
LDVLHFPAKYKVPSAWAAGMQARLPSADREILGQSQLLVHVPLHRIHALPSPKDIAAALWTLGQVPPGAVTSISSSLQRFLRKGEAEDGMDMAQPE